MLAEGGFVRVGAVPRFLRGFLRVDGERRDHHLFRRLPHDDPPPA
ncbi:hypothetical protein [Streptomyces sp. bgisy082]